MKKKISVIFLILLAMTSFYAKGTPLAVGFGLANSAGNFGLNLEVSSPTFAYDFLIVRAKSQVDFLSSPLFDTSLEWEPFSSHRIGLVGSSGWNSETIRLYGEFGGILCLPPSKISKDSMHFGIYGLFGFEFFFMDSSTPISYYLEAGSDSLFGKADKLPSYPSYYNGFSTKTGMRVYF